MALENEIQPVIINDFQKFNRRYQSLSTFSYPVLFYLPAHVLPTDTHVCTYRGGA